MLEKLVFEIAEKDETPDNLYIQKMLSLHIIHAQICIAAHFKWKVAVRERQIALAKQMFNQAIINDRAHQQRKLALAAIPERSPGSSPGLRRTGGSPVTSLNDSPLRRSKGGLGSQMSPITANQSPGERNRIPGASPSSLIRIKSLELES